MTFVLIPGGCQTAASRRSRAPAAGPDYVAQRRRGPNVGVVVGFTRGFALEGARHGVTANAIAPGLIETPMLASMNDAARELLTNKVPMRHTGQPEDIASAAAFLCSGEAGYITGVVLDVDGGIGIGSSIR
jgi:3-oxoacyl-[acyl-carrier protein] reductase